MSSYPGFGASSGRNIDMSRFVKNESLNWGSGGTDMATRTETDLAQNIRKATSIGTAHTLPCC
jgi:hypothetical protein